MRGKPVTLSELDYEGIRSLLARSSQTLDFADADGFANCFTPDGVLSTTWPQVGLAGEHVGSAGLKAFVEHTHKFNAGRVRHTASSTRIHQDDDGVRATSYVIVTRDYGPPEIPGDLTYSELLTTGIYFDQFAQADGRWVFSRREFHHDGTPAVLELSSAAVGAAAS
jgi:hypothetical protein